MRVLLVVGCRPEILKIYSVVKELDKRKIPYQILFTNQHFSEDMGKSFFNELGITKNIVKYEEYGNDVYPIPLQDWLKSRITDYKPDIVLVQGDTKSAFYGALTAFELGIKVGHIEAGLRSFDLTQPVPEEGYRCAIDGLSTYLFCPTTKNFSQTSNLKDRKRYVVGNTIIDLIKEKIKPSKQRKNQIIITCHRRENWDKIIYVCNMLKLLKISLPDVKFIIVMHKNPELQKIWKENLKDTTMELRQPMKYLDFIKLCSESKMILSDSGGIVEEASYLSVPVGILRNTTERTESVEEGVASIIGIASSTVIKAKELYNLEYNADKTIYGKGDTAKQILDILERELK